MLKILDRKRVCGLLEKIVMTGHKDVSICALNANCKLKWGLNNKLK